MRRSTVSSVIRQSLFDRITDLEPRSKNDIPPPSWEQSKDLKDSVARDLTSLLNVRRSESEIDAEFEEANRSIAAFGMQDFSASPIDKEQVRRAIEKCVRTFEPRLSYITVHLVENVPHRLAFRISATLEIEKRSEPVLFDATVPIHSRRIQIDEGR